MMNWDWNDDSATWTCGAPYGWTDHTLDVAWNRPFPATFWSALESLNTGLAIYDRGIPARSWNPSSDQCSIVLLQQNDPYEGPGSTDSRAAKEKMEFEYDELENYTLEFAFEYYSSSWANASIPQHGRNFNHPLYISIVYNPSNSLISALEPYIEDFNLNVALSKESNSLPNWGSFFESNSSNVILTAFKPAIANNSLVLRLFAYPYSTSEVSQIKLKFFDNMPNPIEMKDANLVSALEQEFGGNPADPSLNIIPKHFSFQSVDNTLEVPSMVLLERVVRTLAVPIETSDVMAPVIEWNTDIFGMIGFPLNIQVLIHESSNFTIFGIYSEDAGITWKNLPSFKVFKFSDKNY
jgi:hypothetical protein